MVGAAVDKKHLVRESCGRTGSRERVDHAAGNDIQGGGGDFPASGPPVSGSEKPFPDAKRGDWFAKVGDWFALLLSARFFKFVARGSKAEAKGERFLSSIAVSQGASERLLRSTRWPR